MGEVSEGGSNYTSSIATRADILGSKLTSDKCVGMGLFLWFVALCVFFFFFFSCLGLLGGWLGPGDV